MIGLPVLQQQITPGDCVLTGLCGVVDRVTGPHSGVMFLAVGLVALGVWGWWRTRRRRVVAPSVEQ